MSDTPTSPRTVDGVVLPEPGTYAIDPVHSHVGFSVRHLMISKVRGRFTEFTATLTIAEDPFESSLEVNVDAASIDTRDEQRDTHLRSPDFFDVEKFPTLTYQSTAIKHQGGDAFRVDGDVTIHGVTRPLTLDCTFDGLGKDPWGNERLGFTASAEIDREEFGLTWNQALETGGVLVGRQIRIEIEAEFVRQ